jgi:ribokinase
MPALRVVVIGGLNMDLVVRVAQLPRPGETITGADLLRAAGGKGGNQAVAAARLGAAVTMIGRIGRDAFGRELSRGLRAAGVSTRWVLPSERPTGAALIMVDERGENVIAVAPGANASLSTSDLPPRAFFGRAEVVVASLEVPLDTITAAFRIARQASAHTVLNAAPAQTLPASLLALSDVLICNEVELATLVGKPVAACSEGSAAEALRSSEDQVVVVTLGERGALAVGAPGVVEQPGFGVTVLDTVGAGDAFVGGFVAGRWWSGGLAASLRVGCAAGALATTVAGAQPSMPSLDQVQALLSRR